MVLPKRRKTNKIKRNYWKEEEEDLLKQWADKAQCFQWMHNRSREIYQRKNAMYTIPVIIISTITGTANFAQDRFSEKIKEYVVMTIGSLSIIAGIITTIYQFLKISEINEGHRVASLSWGKFHRNLESELRRHPLDRTGATELIKMSKEEYNRLVEISPFIPKKVLNEFNKKFKKNKTLTKPPIGNTIDPTNIFTMNKDERKKMVDDLNDSVIAKNNIIMKKENKVNNQITKFRKSFYNLNNRYPTRLEIGKNMKYINEGNYTSDSDNSNDLEKGQDINLEIEDREFYEDNVLGDTYNEHLIDENNISENKEEDSVSNQDADSASNQENVNNQEEDSLINQDADSLSNQENVSNQDADYVSNQDADSASNQENVSNHDTEGTQSTSSSETIV